MITTTLNKIRARTPCEPGWNALLKHLGKTKADDEEFPMSLILESNDFDDCLWAIRSRPDLSRLWRLYAVDAVRQVEYLITDERSKNVLNVAERHADGLATDEELSDAWCTAFTAARSASCWHASLYAVAHTCRQPACVNAFYAAEDAITAACDNAEDFSEDVAGAAKDVQKAMLKELLDTGKRPIWPTPKQ